MHLKVDIFTKKIWKIIFYHFRRKARIRLSKVPLNIGQQE